MRMIRPQVETEQVTVAEEQPEFSPITAALVTDPSFRVPNGKYNTLLLAFRPTEDERRRLAAGEDLYIGQLTGGAPMQALSLVVGAAKAAALYNVPLADGVVPDPTAAHPSEAQLLDMVRAYRASLTAICSTVGTPNGATVEEALRLAAALRRDAEMWRLLCQVATSVTVRTPHREKLVARRGADVPSLATTLALLLDACRVARPNGTHAPVTPAPSSAQATEGSR